VCCSAIGKLGGIHDYFGQCRLKISFFFNKKRTSAAQLVVLGGTNRFLRETRTSLRLA
jgi:hypothetical protein